MLKQINGGHLLYTDYYNACTGKFIRTKDHTIMDASVKQ